AVAEMALEFAPHAAISLKWPNDVLADDKKLAGMLLESGGDWLAIGIGVNLAHSPRATEFPATALAQLGIVPPSPQDALRVLAGRFAHWYDVWMQQGFETIRTAWLARAHGLGGPIRARLPHESHDGVFEGLDAEGALLLNQQGRVRTITAGEVFF
ncbi:MAG TPA: biotin--[acetyl-CoA-carboxylase] ligase, partial [Rhizomicrobium sp.]|nr:biotin--[acetyl-CoA-carboxylase] ligase [Rhizomicrobium sp.]